MKVYIPKHLRRIPIIEQLCSMISEYSKKYAGENDQDSFSDYRYSLRNDAVVRFLDYVLDFSDDLVKRNVITYLSTMFYSVKGTYKVLDYITAYDLFGTGEKSMENVEEHVKITYTTQSLSIEIDDLPERFDRDLFCEYLEQFLCALLYFQSLTISIENMGTRIEDNTTTSLNYGSECFQYYEAREEED